MVCGNPSALEMGSWHTNENVVDGAHCGTTHCLAGWAVALGGKAGYELEQQTDTAWAALQIFRLSSPSIPVRMHFFYQSNEEGLAGIRERAEQERQLSEKS